MREKHCQLEEFIKLYLMPAGYGYDFQYWQFQTTLVNKKLSISFIS